MKKIIMTAKHLDAGGIETFITAIYPFIDKSQYSIDFLITQKEENDPKGFFEDDLINQGAKVYRISSKSKNPVRAFKDLKKFFQEHPEYEIFHINDGGGSAFPLYIAKRYSKCKMIVHCHNAGSKSWKQNLVMKLFRGYVLSNAKCVACSKKAADWMFGENSSREILYYGIETDKFRYDVEARNCIRKRYGINEDEYLIGHVGRFNVQKNHDYLLDIFYEYHKINSKSKLMLVGTGELENKIKEKINNYGLTECVVLTGTTKQVEQYMSAMDIMIFPSLFEGFSIVLIEAQANGLRCLISDTITEESCITELAQRKSINEPAIKWSDEIERIRNEGLVKREQYVKIIKEKGCDRQNTADNLMKIYKDIFL